ncbi:MAG: hypothetical protein U0791_03980 [Gemmataceae bacterium]
MGKTLSTVLLVAAIGFVAYLAATGVTLNDCGRWVERHTGVRLKPPEVRDGVHLGYSPITPGTSPLK